MTVKIPVPEGMRWQIASRIASAIPVFYGMFLRERMGNAFDLTEQHVWVALAHEAGKVTHTYDLSTRTAGDLADTLGVITTIFFGPELKIENAVFEDDRAVLIIRRCPFQLREQELGAGCGDCLNFCLAFFIATVEALNPAYALRFIRSSCQGDRHCEMKITRKQVTKEEEKNMG
jgi:hypothetical protein